MNRSDSLWLSLLVTVVFLFWLPVLQFHPSLAHRGGDFGRDLYAFWITFQGGRACQNFTWPYGPLMPLYYAFWFLLGGVNLISVRIGVMVNYLFCCLITYGTLRVFVSPAVAFLASLFFLSFHMGWTYNHLGAIPFMLGSIFFLWKFFITRRVWWCYFGVLALVGVALVKISAGIFSLVAFLLSLCFYNLIASRKNCFAFLPVKHFVFLSLMFGGLVFGSYGLWYFGIPWSWVDQCVTASPRYRIFGHTSLLTNFKRLAAIFLDLSTYHLLIFETVVLAYLGLQGQKLSWDEKTSRWGALVSLFLFGLVHSTEYLLIGGMTYRLSFWWLPLLFLGAGLCAEWGKALFSRSIHLVLGLGWFLLILWSPFLNLKTALTWRIPERYVNLPHGQVYMGGELPDVETVIQGSRFIHSHTQPHERILAIPFDSVYCFLSGRRHAVREGNFFRHLLISREREDAIIRKLEEGLVPYIVLSNRYRSTEPWIGFFGKTHCQKLARYIFKHYKVVKTLGGPWTPYKWTDAHGIKILKAIQISTLSSRSRTS